ncbi:MAG: serine/threonine protein kinase [Myxococcales bacterium]|nr:serine/threonine protein kinase [Myxococcales bacterium]MCB9732181.1 serine/threonine protein kinase [Deltaproteobacteria bacterium]
MEDRLDARAELESRWTEAGLEVGDLVPDTGGTIAHRAARLPNTLPGTAAAAEREAEGRGVSLGAVLGQGGIGVVHLGEQAALHREVAVKLVRPERRSPVLETTLLREAWVTGNLEHPNIVPVHDLIEADAGPMMVMKRVEGVAWSDLFNAPEAVARLTDEAPFEWHLRVLATICHALHFAHARGVLHLDLKPHNVMIGRFGEVYVVDWGLAVSTGDGPAWLPRADTIATVCGTPAYMSPEQAAGDGARLGPATDVFQLGAILHELVTGKRRHGGTSIRDAIVAAYTCAPFDYGDDVPVELREILADAMARGVDDRIPSADALRRRIEAFLQHRSSRKLSDRGRALLDDVRADLAGGAHGATRAFQECRFAFRQALAEWPDNHDARDGLREMLCVAAEHALARRQPERAAELLDELDAPAPELSARLRALEAEVAAEAERVAQLQHDANVGFLTRHRSILAAIGGVFWLFWNVLCGYLHRERILVFGPVELTIMALVTILIYAGVMVSRPRSMWSSAVNRRTLLLFGVGFLIALMLWGQAAIMGLDGLHSLALAGVTYCFFLAGVAITVDRRVGWGLVVVVPLSVAMAVWSEWAWELAGLTGLFVGSWVSWVWRPRGDGPMGQDPDGPRDSPRPRP